jgi:hypothetical protein
MRGKIRPRATTGPRCTICRDPRLYAISAALATGRSERSVAREFGFTQATMNTHCREHVGEALAAYNISQPILSQIRLLNQRVLRILAVAEDNNEKVIALAAVREIRHNSELIARLTGELKSNPESAEGTIVEIRYVDVPRPQLPAANEVVVELTRRLDS